MMISVFRTHLRRTCTAPPVLIRNSGTYSQAIDRKSYEDGDVGKGRKDRKVKSSGKGKGGKHERDSMNKGREGGNGDIKVIRDGENGKHKKHQAKASATPSQLGVAAIISCGNDYHKANTILQDLISENKASLYAFHAMLKICSKNGLVLESLTLIDYMKENKCLPKPDVSSYNMAIAACARVNQHDQAIELLMTTMKNDKNVEPDVISYTSTIDACRKSGEWEKALELFDLMIENKITPNVYTFSAVITACEKGGKWERAVELLEMMKTLDIKGNVFSYSAAISACGKSGRWEEAISIFDSMIAHQIEPNVISFNACINACRIAEQHELALEMFHAMPTYKLRPNLITYCTVMWACIGQEEQLIQVWEQLESSKDVTPNRLCYSAMMYGCVNCGNWPYAVKVFESLRSRKIAPDLIILNQYIEACIILGKWSDLYNIFNPHTNEFLRSSLAHEHHKTAIRALVQRGLLEEALEVFEQMQTGENKDKNESIIFGQLVKSFANRGEEKTAFELFDFLLLREVRMELYNFNNAIDACKHTAEVYYVKALDYFNHLKRLHLEPDIVTYSSLIDVLERAGRREEANSVLKEAFDTSDCFPGVWSKSKDRHIIDLHNCTSPVARTVLRSFIDETVSKFNDWDGSQEGVASCFPRRNIVVITGQGHESNQRPVLLYEIRDLVKRELDCDLLESDNLGSFSIRKEDIDAFLFNSKKLQK